MRANISYIGTTKVLSSPNDIFISPYQTLGECLVCSYCELLHKFFWIVFGFSSFLFICLFFYNFFLAYAAYLCSLANDTQESRYQILHKSKRCSTKAR